MNLKLQILYILFIINELIFLAVKLWYSQKAWLILNRIVLYSDIISF